MSLNQIKFFAIVISCFIYTVYGMDEKPWKFPPSLPPDTGGVPHDENGSLIFDCKGRKEGYYGDLKLGCIVFHYCSNVQKRHSYKCKDGKKFDETTSSCMFYLEENVCKLSGSIADDNQKKSRNMKFIFPAFPHAEIRNEISKAFSSNDGIGALSAFASLAQSRSPVFNQKFQDTKASETERIHQQEFQNPPRQNKKIGRTSEPLSSYNPRLQQKETSTHISRSDATGYQNIYTDLKGSEDHLHHDRRFYSPPVYHPREKNYQDTIDVSHHQTSPLRSLPRHETSINLPPTSHINFTPPGSNIANQHSISHSQNGGTFNNFHPPNFIRQSNRPKPPSVFGSPAPSPIRSSTPGFRDFVRAAPLKDDAHEAQYYDDLGSLYPYSTPSYYDYDVPYYHSPVPLADPYYPYDPTSSIIERPLHKKVLSVPNNHDSLRPLHPGTFVNHPSFSSPKTHLEGVRNRPQDLKTHLPKNAIVTTEKNVNLQKKSRVRKPYVTNNPILHVTKPPSPSSSHYTNEDYYDTIDFNNQDYDVNINHHDNENLNKELDIDVTTYAPATTPKTVQKLLKPKNNPGLPNRNKLSTRRRRPTPIRTRLPTKAINKENKGDEIKINDEAITQVPEISENSASVSKSDQQIKVKQEEVVAPQPVVNKPKSVSRKPSILRGGLKERLNRLNTRRNINRGNRGRTQNLPKTIGEPTTPIERKPLKRPVSVLNNDESVSEENISPANTKKLKSRVSNFFKNRVPPRTPTVRRPTRTRVVSNNSKKIIDITNEEEQHLVDDDSSNLQTQEKKIKLESPTATQEQNVGLETTTQIPVTNLPKVSVKRKRPMNPDVRARFKDFLKNRKNGLDSRKQTRVPAKKLEKEADNVVQKVVIETTTVPDLPENENVLDSSGSENLVMKKSIPLFRTEAIVPLINMEPVENSKQAMVSNQPSAVQDSDASYSRPIVTFASAKPFRYLINRRKTVSDFKNYEAQQQKKIEQQKPKNLEITPSITSHKIVQPPNFKQIVRMSPRIPLSETIAAFTTQETDKTKRIRRINEVANSPKSSKPTVSSIPQKFPMSTRALTKSTTLFSPVTPSYINLALEYEAREKTEKTSKVQEKPIIHREKSKPVFNLDFLDIKDDRTHMSALDSVVGKNEPSSVHFEPFSIDTENPMLPIEKLLRLN